MNTEKQAVPVAQELMYLIHKNGMFYRPNAQGYTCDAAYAGRFTFSEAIRHSHPNGPDGPRDGIDYMPTDEPTAIEPARKTDRFDPALPCKSGEGAGAWEGPAYEYGVTWGSDDAHPDATPSEQFAKSSPDAEIDRLAQFLHDEGGFGDAMTDRTWPEHDADTGQRENGWVKIVPSDVVAKFRDVARRWLLPRATSSPDAAGIGGEAREAIAMASRLQQARHSAVEPVERDNVLCEAATLLRRFARKPIDATQAREAELREARDPCPRCGGCGEWDAGGGRCPVCEGTGIDPGADDDSSTIEEAEGGAYLVWSNEHRAWWGKDQRGYTKVIANAGRYDRDTALTIAGTRGGGWRLNKGNPDEIAIPETDAIDQYASITAEQLNGRGGA